MSMCLNCGNGADSSEYCHSCNPNRELIDAMRRAANSVNRSSAENLDLISRVRSADRLQKNSQKEELVTLIIEEIKKQQKCSGHFRCKIFALNVVFPVILLLAKRSIAIHVEYPVDRSEWTEGEKLLIYWDIPITDEETP